MLAASSVDVRLIDDLADALSRREIVVAQTERDEAPACHLLDETGQFRFLHDRPTGDAPDRLMVLRQRGLVARHGPAAE